MNTLQENISKAILITDLKKIIDDYKDIDALPQILLNYLSLYEQLEDIDIVKENTKLKQIIKDKNDYIKNILSELEFKDNYIADFIIKDAIKTTIGKAFDYDGALEDYNKREQELIELCSK
jgi:hypothetical protein